MKHEQTPFILAVSPSPRGFAFVIFQGGERPFDWSVKEIRGSEKNIRSLAAIAKLLDQYHPEAVVIEETRRGSRRGFRIRSLLKEVATRAEREGIVVGRYTKAQVRATFAAENARTRPAIAQTIAARIPAFAPRLPRLQKIWMSEDPRQSLFDAAALGLTYYAIKLSGETVAE
jgi:hypothetical protein